VFTISRLAPSTLTTPPVTLADRWGEQARDALMSGVQAIVRALLDQRRDDVRAGIASAGFVSGYPGSPLAGLDRELQRRAAELGEAGIVFQPGVNEELAATAIWGSQLAHLQRGATVKGVLGMWFGKSPGLDRAADALRHANVCGVGPASGVVAVVGDDPACKSSTLPSASERLLSSLMMPVLAPASVQDVLDLGRHALRLSRASGLWCALKVVADVADASASVVHRGGLTPARRLVRHTPTAHLLGAAVVEIERGLVQRRLPAALAYAAEHELNPTTARGERDEVGLIAGGAAYAQLERALLELGLGANELRALGVRVMKLGMLWPFDRDGVRAFARGLRTVLVVEDKLPFLQGEVEAALHGEPAAPQVLGKQAADGGPLLAAHGALDADEIALVLGRVLGDRLPAGTQAALRLQRLAGDSECGRGGSADPLTARAPYFCSGCPHSTATAAAPDTLVGAGIGCHVMLVQDGERRGGDVTGLTQMGGEGAQWIGISPFVAAEHFTQNIGDGTFHHSGSLALRAAVAAGVNVTYKLLYNDAVAMTGGQRVEGMMPVRELTAMLMAEGVARIAVSTEDTRRYRGVRVAPGVNVYDRSQLPQVERELAAVRGVTVIVHDQMCAAERRRLRRRGELPAAPERPWINERVCEGCGDCGERSGCLSVEPVQTPLGRKTRINQDSCNEDLSCLRGDCPAFLTVQARQATRRRPSPAPPDALPEPPSVQGAGSATIRMIGIGGTGVVTTAQTLALAAHLEGRPVSVLDQTGLSQKAGTVVSDVRIGDVATSHASPRATRASVDLLLGFDLLGAADPRLAAACDRERTLAVLSTALVPTSETVLDADARPPDRDVLLAAVARNVAATLALADAQLISRRAFGEEQQANIVLLGAAFQTGALPVGWEALIRAVELPGVAVQENVAALLWGRAVIADPEAVRALVGESERPPAAGEQALAPTHARKLPARLHDFIAWRAEDLSAYGGHRVAGRYLDELERIAAVESERTPGRVELTESVARQLHRLLAYKDEYEVARLHLLPEERRRRERELGADARTWLHLHPPLLRSLGLSRKIRLGRSASPLLHVLRACRRLRGTPLDVFGHTEVRRLERALPGEYLTLLQEGIELLRERNHADVVALSELVERIRGYERIKLRNVETWRAACAVSLRRLRQAPDG
jgi:indolepyruvate ferredoxin oxidoreductase